MDKGGVQKLLVRADNGDRSAKEELVSKNLGLVGSIVKRFEHRGHDREELFQIGVIGLIQAIDRFDLSFGVEFSTYAVPLIRGEIQRFLRDDGPIHVSRSLKEHGWRVEKAAQRLRQQKGAEPSLGELALETGLGREEIVMAMEANAQVESIEQAESQKGYSDQERLLNKMTVEQLLETLQAKEKELIRLRYYEEYTQVKTAQALGMTQVQVSRLEKKILVKLRSRI